MPKEENDLMEKIVSLCKRRGFVFPSSEVHGGFAGFYDYGHYGVAFSTNIKDSWWKEFVETRIDIYGLNSSIILNPKVWEKSGHVASFSDPMEGGSGFNVMFKTSVGAGEEATTAYLRPEDWEKYFEYWRVEMLHWLESIGIEMKKVHELEVPENERAHYSKRTVDFEVDFPFGRKALFGLAYRTDFDLKNHGLDYLDEETGEKLVPHVIEPSLGVDRMILAILVSAYTEDKLVGEARR